MAIGNVVRPAGRQDRGDPTLGGDGLVSAGKTVKGRSITAEMRSLTAYANRPSPVPQGPVTRGCHGGFPTLRREVLPWSCRRPSPSRSCRPTNTWCWRRRA